MSEHAKLSASGSSRWLNCAGSIKAEEGYPDTSSPAAEEGTAAHELAEACLTRDFAANALIGNTFNKHVVTAEMAGHVQEYIDYLNLLHTKDTARMIEVRVDFSDIVPEGFGTSDAIIIDGETLHVVDLKYGQGVWVYAENNTQGMLYALGAINEVKDFITPKRVLIHIHQPRLDNVDVWEISVDDLNKWAAFAAERAELALTDDAPREPSDKACQWCKAAPSCAALRDMTEATIMTCFDKLDLDSPDVLDDEALGLVMKNKALIASWLSSVEGLVRERVESGAGFKGFKMVAGRSSRVWSNEAEADALLTNELGGVAAHETKLLSPAKAEKALGKAKKALLDGYITTNTGKPTLAPESDKRPAINLELSDFD